MFDCSLHLMHCSTEMGGNGNSECYRMFDDQDLGFFANFLGIFIFVLVIAYHYVMADPKYEGN
ncbi:Dolichyl-diphosphooligosaccharide--protein glycosyltransferase [Populus alba x Populus x berolinensis]|nr:Dolichyl-diphosphooligosaccharide--protein glycosyltransferase [Populus alba x Populus x berolinensis]